MNKQTKILKMVVSVIGVLVILVLTSFAVVKNYPAETTHTSNMRIRDIVRSRTTWNIAFES